MRGSTGSRQHFGSKAPTRRDVLRAAIAAAAVLGGSAIALVRTGGYDTPPGLELAVLSPWQFVVVQHAARRIAAPDRPGDPAVPAVDDLGVPEFVDGWLARLPRRTRRDLRRFLAYLEHLAPLSAGLVTRFTRLSPADQDRVLAGLEASSSDLLRAGFDGLRALVFLGYYRHPRTWRLIGYDGPLAGRPEAGWW